MGSSSMHSDHQTTRATLAKAALLHRACACGQHKPGGGECSECRKERLANAPAGLQRAPLSGYGRGAGGEGVAPPTVGEVLRSPGRPLDGATRAFMEPRFGHDFTRVQVHTDAKAAESARAVNALAYTVGREVVFGTGQYSPQTSTGQRVLAHELTHVVQQNEAAASASRLDIGTPDSHWEREADHIARTILSSAAHQPAAVAPESSLESMLPVQHAGVSVQRLGDLTRIPPGLPCPSATDSPSAAVIDFTTFPNQGTALSDLQKTQIKDIVRNWRAAGGSQPIRVDGYASKPGSDESNWRLSCERAMAVAEELKNPSSGNIAGIPARFITVFMQGETDEFGDEGANRRVTVAIAGGGVPPTPPPSTPPPTPETNLCGPNISQPLANVLADVRSTFSGWAPNQKREACDTITSLFSAVMAWDITDLFLPCTDWLCRAPYHPPCGMPPATGCNNEDENDCGNSVQVSGKCFLAGTVNYALFGQICKLCCDEFGDLCEPTMIRLIQLWKLLPNPSQGFDDPGPPTAWARAGFHGYPGHIPITPNRPRCAPRCPVPYSGPAFRWVWEPHQTRSGCPSMP